MNFIIILIVIAAIAFLGYIFYPSIKKFLSSKMTSSGRKERVKKEKKIKEPKEKAPKGNVEIIQNEGNLFEDSSKTFEDPDTKVDYDNFDLDGLFEDETSSRDDFLKSSEDPDENNFNDFFNKYFLNEESDNSDKSFLDTKTRNRLMKNEDLSDLFDEDNITNNKSDISAKFENLPNEMKVLMLSNFLDRKEDI